MAAATNKKVADIEVEREQRQRVAAQHDGDDAEEGDDGADALAQADPAAPEHGFKKQDDDRRGGVDQRAVGGRGPPKREIDAGTAYPHTQKRQQDERLPVRAHHVDEDDPLPKHEGVKVPAPPPANAGRPA
ncbi:MAG: hypothetical protein NVV73_03380 [Cellvibrionaceae bacterium]|nr:hypothetical protein [Cellvibrionaceae bacterium]